MLEMTLRRDTGREKVMLAPTLVADFLPATVRKRGLNRAWLPLGTKPTTQIPHDFPSSALISDMMPFLIEVIMKNLDLRVLTFEKPTLDLIRTHGYSP